MEPFVTIVENIDQLTEEQFFCLLYFCKDKEKYQSIENVSVRNNSLVAEVLRAYLTHKLYGILPSEQAIAYGKQGKPYLKDHPDICFSVSHSDNTAGCAIYEKEVGFDLQAISPYSRKVAEKMFSEEEISKINTSEEKDKEFTRFWTRHEAAAKLEGLSVFTQKKDIDPDILFIEGEEEHYLWCVAYKE